MQSSFNILSALYRIVNVPVVTNRINGKVYIGNPPKASQLEDIGLNLLNNPKQYLQDGYGNLNIYVPMLAEDRHNLGKLKELTDSVMPLLDEAQITWNGFTYHFDIDDDKGVFVDEDRDGMSYYNIRLNFQTIK